MTPNRACSIFLTSRGISHHNRANFLIFVHLMSVITEKNDIKRSRESEKQQLYTETRKKTAAALKTSNYMYIKRQKSE